MCIYIIYILYIYTCMYIYIYIYIYISMTNISYNEIGQGLNRAIYSFRSRNK